MNTNKTTQNKFGQNYWDVSFYDFGHAYFIWIVVDEILGAVAGTQLMGFQARPHRILETL